MKNARKLIPAIAMLLVATVMMSTASFAWFSMNKDVTATGMSVTAKSNAQFLLIGTADNATDKTNSLDSIAATNAAKEVYPAGFTVSGTTVGGYTAPAKSWYTANSADTDKANDNVISGRKIDDADLGDYTLANDFYLTLSTGSEDYTGSLTITFALASGDAAVSAVVKIGDNYYPVNSTTTTATATGITLTSATSLQVTVYTYVDGASANVNSEYIISNTLTGGIELTFEIA